jgi:hypothetical protein
MLTPIPLTPIVGRLALPRLKPLGGLTTAYERQWTLAPSNTLLAGNTVHFFTAVRRAIYTSYVVVPAACRHAVAAGTPPYPMLDFVRVANRQIVQPGSLAASSLGPLHANGGVAGRRGFHAFVISASALAVIGALVIYGELHATYKQFVAAPQSQTQTQISKQAAIEAPEQAHAIKPEPAKLAADTAPVLAADTRHDLQVAASLAEATKPHSSANRVARKARVRRAAPVVFPSARPSLPPAHTESEPDDVVRLLAETRAREGVPPQPAFFQSSTAENRVAPQQHHRVTERPDLFLN